MRLAIDNVRHFASVSCCFVFCNQGGDTALSVATSEAVQQLLKTHIEASIKAKTEVIADE